jgi:endonuclease YncB( thermonuclease family)
MLFTLLSPGAAPSPAAASTTDFNYWYGTVVRVYDGDTIEVLIDGTKTAVPIRNAEIQALELKHPTNNLKADECHSRQAKKYMTQLVLGDHREVRLSAEHPGSQSFGRAVRFVDVNMGTEADPVWLDVQQAMLQAGLALWKPEVSREPAHNALYHVYAEQAMRAGVGIYDTDSCDPGPRQGTKISMYIQWNGYSVKAQKNTVNGEYVRIFNPSSKALRISHWVLRDASHVRHFSFPKGATIPARGSVVVHAGHGKNSRHTFYWGLPHNPFRNAVFGQAWPGDGLYLVDRDGDYRTWFVYPCASDCTDPLEGQVEISKVVYDAAGDDQQNPNGEWVDIKSTSSKPVDLSWYVIDNPPYTKVIPGGTVLKPGESLRLKMGSGISTLSTSPVKLYLGARSGVLNNTGDIVSLRTFSEVRLDCYAWGTKASSC